MPKATVQPNNTNPPTTNLPFMERLNERFTDIADWVSSSMGTPLNIILWLLAVIAWFLLFAFNPGLQNSNFMPSWFTSLPFNLPLNLITTLAELYIGFLVAAAANRVERHNEEMLRRIDATNQHEEAELSSTEKHLLAQDEKILEIARRIENVERIEQIETLKQTDMLQRLIDLLEAKEAKKR